MQADGSAATRRANLNAGSLAWLAARKDGRGRPWLTRRALAAAERLQVEHERCGVIGRLTMSWEGGARGGGPAPLRVDPAEQARAAKARLRAALLALAPPARAAVEAAVLRHEPLEAVERSLGLARRTAKTLLAEGLEALADHWRMG